MTKETAEAVDSLYAIAVLDGHNKPERVHRAIVRLVSAVFDEARRDVETSIAANVSALHVVQRAEIDELRASYERLRRLAYAYEEAATALLCAGCDDDGSARVANGRAHHALVSELVKGDMSARGPGVEGLNVAGIHPKPAR